MRPLIAGNWKMNMGPSEARRFGEVLSESERPDGVRLALFPPAVSLTSLVAAAPESIECGCQNVYWEPEGAFTGELSVAMVAEAGARQVLVGHSERRHVFGESDADTARKVSAVLDAGLTPVLCVGETLEEREAGLLSETLLRQLDVVLDPPELREAMETSGGEPLVLAYEPVWAIGTGRTATPADASEAHSLLRERLVERLGPAVGQTIPILYGGSVRPANARELLAAPEVGGVLVGGASLDPESFLAIADAAR